MCERETVRAGCAWYAERVYDPDTMGAATLPEKTADEAWYSSACTDLPSRVQGSGFRGQGSRFRVPG